MNSYYPVIKSVEYQPKTQTTAIRQKIGITDNANNSVSNDTISLNVDFSTDGTLTDNELVKKSTENQLMVTNLSKKTETNQIINPGKYSLELSTLSSFSPMSTVTNSMTGMPKMEASLSMPSISMELESVNEKLMRLTRRKSTNSKLIDSLSENDSTSSIFTSISSELDASALLSQKYQKKLKRANTISKAEFFNGSQSINCIAEKSGFKPISDYSCPLERIIRRASYNVYAKHDQLKVEREANTANLNLSSNFKPKNDTEIRQKLQLKLLNAEAVKQQEILVKYKNRNKPPHIDIIDNHLLVLIFSKLSTVEKLMLQFVCKKWHHIIWSQDYSYTLFKHVEISNFSIPLYCYNFNFMNVMKERDNNKMVVLESNKKGFIEILKGKFSLKEKSCCGNKKKSLANKNILNKNTNLEELKENNFLKFHVNADRVLEFLLDKLLNRQTYPFSICVEKIQITNNHWLSDKGIDLISKRCPELRTLSIKKCSNVKTASIINLILKCHNLKNLDLTGCFKISNIINKTSKKEKIRIANKKQKQQFDVNFNLLNPINNYFYLKFIDLSYCANINDTCILNICQTCIFLKIIYLKKCQLITDFSILYITKYCLNLKELSLANCERITDSGIKYLTDSRLLIDRPLQKFEIKYLNLAQCIQITDESLIHLCKQGFFKSIKRLNLRGCTLVTDKFMKYFSGSCYIQKLQAHYDANKWNSTGLHDFIPFQLKSLDLAKCSLTDKSLEYLCRMISIEDNLERLCVSGCLNISDYGVRILSLNCKRLLRLNVKKCRLVTARSLKEMKLNCHRCVIQHTNFSIC